VRIYAGIDEAGYGPLFGPMVVGCWVLTLPKAGGWDVWERLHKAVCKTPAEAKRSGRIAVNDSKKLTGTAAGLAHLETGVLSFAALCPSHKGCAHLGDWLNGMGDDARRDWSVLPWYAPCNDNPWQPLPFSTPDGELAVHRGLLRNIATQEGVSTAGFRGAVVAEDRFNELVARTRSKASVSFSFVARHLWSIWQTHGHLRPVVAVDRQSGRMRYRELLAQTFAEDHAELTVLEESPDKSAYRITNRHRQLAVSFEVGAEVRHLPVALASMLSKYTRELLMYRFQQWFSQKIPGVAPTAGYGSDAKRFEQEITPHLSRLGLAMRQLRREL
jgi:ribonuclease HII